MKTLYEVIRRPVRTEKTTGQEEAGNQVVFEVDARANKVEIRDAIEKLFAVKVLAVNTLNQFGKPKHEGCAQRSAGPDFWLGKRRDRR